MEADDLMEELQERNKIEKYAERLREMVGWDRMTYVDRMMMLGEIILDFSIIISGIWHFFSFLSFLLYTVASMLYTVSGLSDSHLVPYRNCYF